MTIPVIFAILLGGTVVLQATLNRHIGEHWGLSFATFLNSIILLLLSGIFFLLSKLPMESWPEFVRGSSEKFTMRWWYLIPGLCGFLLVTGVPWSIRLLGGSKTFILLVSSQVLLGIALDKVLYHQDLSTTKVVGAVLTLLGTYLVVMW